MEKIFNSSTRLKIVLALAKDENHALTVRQLRTVTGAHHDSIQKQCQMLEALKIIEKKNINRNKALWKITLEPNTLTLIKQLDEILHEKIGGNNNRTRKRNHG